MKNKAIIPNLLILALLLAGNLAAGARNLQFDHITGEQGLSNNMVLCILQDSRGFIWIGTWHGGLNRYDGTGFTVYTHDATDPNSISSNNITAILEDPQGILWVGTTNGLNRFDPNTEIFVRFKHRAGEPKSLSDNIICSLCLDKSGHLWIGTHNRGLNKFDHINQRFERYVHDPGNRNGLSHNHVSTLHADKKGRIWIGTGGGGLNTLTIDSRQWARYQHDPGNPLSLSHNHIKAVFEDKKGNIWIGTMGGGLNRLDSQSGQFTRYISNRSNLKALKNNYIFSILEDRDNRFWIGSAFGIFEFFQEKNEFIHHHHIPGDSKSFSLYAAKFIFEDRSGLLWIGSETGINLLDKNRQKFAHMVDEHDLTDRDIPHCLSHNVVKAIHESRDGILWIGTWGGGLNAYDRESDTFTYYKNSPEYPLPIPCMEISCLHEEAGNIWIGSISGLLYFNRGNQSFARYMHDPSNPDSLTDNHVTAIIKGRKGALWIGTRNGLDKFNPHTSLFRHFKHNPRRKTSLNSNHITCLLLDHQQILWIGTDTGGLNRYHENRNTFQHFTFKPGNPTGLSCDQINTIFETRWGKLWIGTSNGLNVFVPENESFQTFHVIDGLPHDNITAILEDENGNLWISTSKGISKFNPEESTFRNYNFRDGLQNGEFTSASCKTRSGEMFFGGMHGINSFFPDRITDNPYLPPVVFTSISIHSQGKKWQTIKSVPDEIRLTYRDTVSVDFASLCYTQPSLNQYAYRISRIHDDWIHLDNNHEIILAGMEPGEYRLQVKASNHDGIWNHKGASIQLTVTPPFWKTWWFRILMVLFIILLILVWYRTRMKNLAHRLKTEAAVSQFLASHDISSREREILKLMLQGKSNKEIEDMLFISFHTVKNHVYHIFQKLKINSRGQLINLLREYLLSREEK
jgi:ligand-binding sensor domain-containing protein/DNA-binding CsgD family transcriptional regulator